MRYVNEEIKGTAHIHFLAGFHIQQRKIDGAATAVGRSFGDVSLDKQLVFAEIGIKILFHTLVLAFKSPHDKRPHRAGRPVRIKHFQAVSLNEQLVADCFQRTDCFLCDQRVGFLIAVNRSPMKL